MKRIKRKPLGFRQALEYILDLLCYAYYVKDDNLVSDHTFDGLEILYYITTGKKHAPMRAVGGKGDSYSNGVKCVYKVIKEENRKPIYRIREE